MVSANVVGACSFDPGLKWRIATLEAIVGLLYGVHFLMSGFNEV
jgi:hypothetical protein